MNSDLDFLQIEFILSKNPTNALIYVNATVSTLLHWYMFSALKGTSSGSTDTFREQGKQNTCPHVNIRLKSSVLCVTWL
jgi:hypothetical protein